ncbi:MAG: hypothetical protein DWQ36_07345 [Acidobacteria bacterium]|nr:MAG: hypothetical protein DWQ30_23255 [Acidobacteriota bacterium]REK09352.1 MAG: hypothetical protein DWQ36_07345 [Acidobacteriota bacterium]
MSEEHGTRPPSRRSAGSPLWRVPARQEVGEEMDHHLELLVRDFERQGHPPEEARLLALERFGDRQRLQQACEQLARDRDRSLDRRSLLRDLSLDLRSAWRQVARNPRFSATVVVGLALGLAATFVVFSWTHALLLRPLPFPEPERLVTLWEAQPHRGQTINVVGPANFVAWRDETTSFEGMTAFITTTSNLTGDGPPLRIKTRLVTDGFFELLGIGPSLGRVFDPSDGEAAGDISPIVLSERFWRSRFGGRSDVAGETVELDGRVHEIVGVLPAAAALDMGSSFRPYTDAPDVYAVLPVSEEWRTARGRWLQVLARLRPGVSVADARAEMEVMAQRLERRFPDFNALWTVNLVPLDEHLEADARTPILLLLCAVSLVLVLLTVNLMSLVLTRLVDRATELSVRSALGAGRRRIGRQILFEGGVLTSAAVGLACALAALSSRAGRVLLPPDLAAGSAPSSGLAVAGFGALAALVCLAVTGALPALFVRGASSGLRDSRSVGGSGALRRALVFVEISLATVLLVGAGLMVRTVLELTAVDPGFDVEATSSFSLQTPGDWESARRASLFDRLLEELEALPQVERAGAVTHVPMSGSGAATSYWPADGPRPDPADGLTADIRVVRGDYLAAMGIELLAGRFFDGRDRADAEQGVVVIDRTLAEQVWPDGEDPLGRELMIHWGEPSARRIVGVIDDVHLIGLGTAPRGTIYFPHEQEPSSTMAIVMRTVGPAAGLSDAVRRVVAELAPELPVYADQSLEQIVAESLRQERFLARSLGVFALAALAIAAFGIYAIASLNVVQRTREIGLRMAMGATPRGIALLFVGQMGRLVFAAIAVGIVVSLLLSRWIESQLFGVEPFDVTTLIAVGGVLAVSALLAVLRPALRAAATAPVLALRV